MTKEMRNRAILIVGALSVMGLLAFYAVGITKTTLAPQPTTLVPETTQPGTERATFALGCFWHSEEMFLELKGVKDAVPGYAGGKKPNPSYDEVGTGETGYAESVDITYDPSVISYRKLLEILFAEHDPTTPNMQYPDEGTQYRSAIFYHDATPEKAAEDYIAKLTAEHKYKRPIVTEVVPFTTFYRAEDYHLRYVQKHPDQSYVAHVTMPELQKFRRDFAGLLK